MPDGGAADDEIGSRPLDLEMIRWSEQARQRPVGLAARSCRAKRPGARRAVDAAACKTTRAEGIALIGSLRTSRPRSLVRETRRRSRKT